LLLLPIFAAPDGCAPPQAVDGYCIERAKLNCRLQYSCCNAAERNAEPFGVNNLVAGGHTNEEECVEKITPLLCQGHAPLEEAQAEARGVWDEAAAADCLDALSRAVDQCDAEDYFAADSDDCAAKVLMEGEQKKGDACFHSAECAGENAACVLNEASDATEDLNTAEGECATLLGAGDNCEDGQCADGLYCSFDGVCEQLAGVTDVYDLCDGPEG
jgi:hypothetical protein